MTLRGVYEGSNPADVLAFERWFGAQVDTVVTFVGQSSWTDFEGSAAWVARDVWSQIDRTIIWSVPLTVQGSTLEAAAMGAYNDHYRIAAQWIDSYAHGEKIYIRTGWEFNGGWMPWSAIGKAQAYIDAFHQIVDTFRSVSDRFVFDWNVNVGNHGMNPADAYPGDAYVDIISMDFYHDPAWDPADPLLAWQQMVYRTYGLNWLENFATAHGKPTAYTEWGLMTNNMGPYIELAKAWFDSHNVVYQNYWDANAGGYTGKLSDGTNPDTGHAFRNILLEANQPAAPEPSDAPVNVAVGSAAAESWSGTDGNDQYTSNGGGDTVRGGFGDDTYVISSTADRVIEWSVGGVDTVVTGLNAYSLPQFVENLTFTGTAASSGTGNELANIIIGNAGANTLDGGAGADLLSGGAGNDVLRGGAGNDTLTGDAGMDTAVYAGAASHYDVLGFNGTIIVAGGSDGMDLLQGVEQVAFADLTMAAFPSPYSYIASYGDLIEAFGANGQAGLDHFRVSGWAEGRHVDFDGLTYIASHDDLMDALGANAEQGALHFIQYGHGEGRQITFDAFSYIASYGDLIDAFGADADLGAAHFITYGRHEGRQSTFDALDYLAANADLIDVFGADASLGARHFVQYGFHEGRETTFDGLKYIASYGDLIGAFGANEDLGALHFVLSGHNEGRATTFDAAAYLAKYGDLQAAFGSDLQAATVHYITYGYHEGRDWL